MNNIMIGLEKVIINELADSNPLVPRKYEIIIKNRNNYKQSISNINIINFNKSAIRLAIKNYAAISEIRLLFNDKKSLNEFSSSLFSILNNNIIPNKSILNTKSLTATDTISITNNICSEKDYDISYMKDSSNDKILVVITFIENNTVLFLDYQHLKKLHDITKALYRDAVYFANYEKPMMIKLMEKANELRPEKNNYYLDIAEATLGRSTCLRRKYGAVIVKDDQIISTGYNGAPRGRKNCCDLGECKRQKMNIPSGERYELCRSVHAEANAIISASRSDMIDSTLYLVGKESDTMEYVKDATCCSMCRRLIINAGIKEVCIRDSKDLFYKVIDVRKEWINEEEI